MKARLRIGVVGAGVVLGRYHIPAINGVPEVVRSIIVDANAEVARQAATRYGFPKWSTDITEWRDIQIWRLCWFLMAFTLEFLANCCQMEFTYFAKNQWPGMSRNAER